MNRRFACTAMFVGVVVSVLCAACASHRQVKMQVQRETVIVPPTLSSVTTNVPPRGLDTRTDGRDVTLTVNADAGLRATYAVAGGASGDMKEVSPGVYQAVYQVPENTTGNVLVTALVRHEPSGAQQQGSTSFNVYRSQPPPETGEAGAAAGGAGRETCDEAAFEQALAALTVRFPFNSKELTDEARTTLDGAGAVFTQHPRCATVYVAGHADDVGPVPVNEYISLARAKSVIGYLAGRGVPVDGFEPLGFGSTRPLVEGVPGAHRKNRRVELHAAKP